MKDRAERIDEFFASYEQHFNDSLQGITENIHEVMARSFADCFIGSGPDGVNCGKNDEQLVNVIRQGIQFYKSIGSKSMYIRHKEITFLDPLHAMCKVAWQYAYHKGDLKGNIDFEIFYFLRTANDDVRIFGYVAGDEQKALKEHGLV